MKPGFMMQDIGYKFRDASCILHLQLFTLFSRENLCNLVVIKRR